MNTKRSITSKIAVLLFALLCIASARYAEAQSMAFPIREMSNKLYGSSLTSGTNTIAVANDQRATMLANPSTFPANVKYKANHTLVKLCIDHAATTVPSAPYIYKMAYTIQGATSMTSAAMSFSASDTLVIAYNPDSLTAYQDIQVRSYPQLYDAQVTITGFFDVTSGTPAALPMPPPNKNFFIELSMQYQPYLMTHSVPGDMLLNTSRAYTGSNQVLTVNWTPNIAPPFLGRVTPAMYELEWTYVDNYAADGTELPLASLSYNFRNNATRIITDSLSYGIPVVYPKGYIVYRVRMVRVDNTNYRYPIYGVWSLPVSGTVSSATTAKYYKITTPHSSDELNWNYTIHFAEGGKYKHVLGYFDGLLKNRQTITRFNTNPSKLLATENIYDFEGRPAITTLPTVIDANGFTYQTNVSISQATTKPYSPYDFDLKPSACPDEPTIPRFTNGSRSNRYYSRLNTDTAGMQKFVPQAEGFPFVHTQLSPGYTDRVDKMGGAGPTLQINKGHDTRHEYMQGDQPDLNNLFGINAGYASFYTKTVSKDPNGQNSMSVKDLKGRQIVSSLIGASVDTTQIAMIFNDEVPAAAKARENKLADTSANIIVGSEKRYNGSFYMDYDAMSNIKYEYDFKPYTVCPAPGYLGLTVKCNYEYDLHDNCGIEVLHKTGVLGITGVSTIASPPPFAEDTNILLNKGKYTIRKTLTIADEDVVAAVDSFFNHKPNCLKTEDDFIREQVEKTTYPCAVEDPCGALKKQMMEELFTGRKYGKWTPGPASLPVMGTGNSIYDIPQTMPDGSVPRYRFQSDCVFAALDSIVIRKFGKVYKHIVGPVMEVTEGGVKKLYDTKADIVTLFKNEIYTGRDQYTIAEALLPLHPEYCKLLACYEDTLAKRLKALPDAATAIKYNMFYLDSIIKKDVDLRNKMAMMPFNYTHFDDTLRTLMGGRVRMDTLASQIAFCMNMDADVFGSAKTFFRNDIVSFNFPNARIRNIYFDNLRSIYLANRDKYLSMSMTAAGKDCPPCDTFTRMKLTPEPVITVLYGPDGGLAGGPDGIMSLFSDTTYKAIKEWLDKTKGMPADTTGVAAMGDSAAYIVHRADSVLCSIAADSIVARLVNCFGSGASTARLKDSLIALVKRKEVKNGMFFPDQVRRAIVTSGLSLSDLCHPYLVSYDYYDETFGGRGNCNSPSFYTAATEFFNEPTINAPLKAASTAAFNVSTPSWPATNSFAMKIDAGLSGGTGSIQMAVQYSEFDSTYTCSFFKAGSDTVQVFFRSPKVIRRGTTSIPFLNVPSTDSIIFQQMTCIFDDPAVSAEGHVGRYMFNARVQRVETIGSILDIQNGQFLGWNNGKVVMNEDGGNPLAAYIPCTQFRGQFNAFKDSMTLYGGFAQDHPLLYKSMRNFMNYNLKRVFSADQYSRFLNSCALSDSMRIPMYGGYARISFPAGSYADFEAFAADVAATDTISLVSVIDYKYGGVETAILDYRMIPYRKIRQFNDRLLAAGGQVKAAPAGIVGRLFLPVGTAPAAFVSGTVCSLSAATNISVKLSPYLPGWDNYDMYDVVAGTPTPLELVNAVQTISERVADLGLEGFWLPNSYAAVNRDYYKSIKQEYLRYVYSMQGLPAPKVLDTLQDFIIRQKVAAFGGTSVTYSNPENAYRFTDLYYTDSSSRYPGYDTVVKVLNYAKSLLGGNKIFMPVSTNKIKVFGDTGSGRNLNMYRCADGLYWYRYFGKDNKLFNIFIRIPEYIYEKQHPSFTLVRILPEVGDTASAVFKAMITIPGSGDTILARGTANFDIAWAQKLRDVLLGNETDYSREKEPAQSGEQGAELNCEQKLLANDVYSGKIEYYNYITKYKADLLAAFRYHVMNQVREKLWIEYIDMRFGITLYSYDRAGNLIQTVPPEGVKKIDTATAKKIDSLRAANAMIPQAIPAHKKATIYEYNTANRPWKEITPDAGTKLLYYDLKGNVLLSQSQRQRDDIHNYYTYFLYDGQNRLTETGQVSWNDSCPSFDPMPLYQFQQGQFVKTQKPFPCACENLIDSLWEFCGPTNTNYYDHSQFVSMIRSFDRGQVVYTVYDSAFTPLETKRNLEAQENLRNRIGANMYYLAVGPGLPGSNYDHATHYSYDASGNIKTLVQEFPQLESFKQRYKRIDYDYDLLSGKVNMISYNRGYADQFFQRYAYDADNRLLKAETSHDGFIWKRDAEYTYYQHGPLARASIGDQRVQGIDYAYTLQGWLKSINGDLADSLSDMGGDGKRSTIVPRDAYATTLDYFTDDYKPIGYTPLSRLKPAGKSLYNGNIARQSTDVSPFGGLTTAYVYDQMNRIRRANYAQTKRDSVLQFNNWYASSYRYDMDGNLRNLMRKQGTGITMDSLRYTYNDSGTNNKLRDILDYAGTATSGAGALEDIRSGLGAGPSFPRLFYDGDGNMTNDFTGGIEVMDWNIYGKTTRIDPMNYTTDLAKMGDIFFGYDALGHRTYKWQQQQVDSGNLYHHTFYVREASGNILAEYNMTKDVAFQDVVKVIRDTRGTVSWGTWTGAIDATGYTLNPDFSGYIISKGGPTSLFPIGYYLAGNPSMRSQFISGGFGALTALCGYSKATGKYPTADALRVSMNPNNAAGTITSVSNAVFGNPDPVLRRRALVQVAQMVPDLYRTIVQQNQLTILTAADSTNLFNIMFNTAQNNLPYYATQLNNLRQQNPNILDNWLNTVTSDSLYTQGQWYQQSGYISLLQNSLVNFGDQAAIAAAAGGDKRAHGLYGFASWWPSSLTVLNSMGYSSGSLAKVGYFNDPVTYLNGLTDYSIIDTALSLVGSIDFVTLTAAAGIPISGPSIYEEPELKSQRISLGNHHLYGSSRLGISNYFPTQFRNFWDFRSGTVDTALNIPMPWYSYVYNDLIDTARVSPWGNSLSRSATAQHLLGQKQYELASQLGNVHAVLSDKRFVKRTGGTLRDYFNASIVAAYDYYPYGQLMPGRYVSDTAPVCVTSTQMRLMPKKTVTDVLPLATFIAPGTIAAGPSGKTVYGQGGGMNIEIPVTAGVPINVVVSLSYIYASFVTVEISEPAGSGRRILASRNYSYPLIATFPVTPSGTGIRVKMMMMSSFISAPPGGLFAASVANYEKVSYESQPVLVTLCNSSKDKYEFGYNGQMKMNEVTGTGNWNTALYWEYATRSAHRANPDPVANPSISPYAVFDGNPIWYSDPLGNVPGDYYASDGSHLGSDGKKDNKAYVADGKKETQVKDDKGIVRETKTEFLNPKELPINHTDFTFAAQTLYAESSPRTSMKEVAAIFSVLENRAKAYGTDVMSQMSEKYPMGVYGSRPKDRERYNERGPAADAKRLNVKAGLILGLQSNTDYSNGGFWWDGTDFKSGGAHEQRYKPGYKFTDPTHDIYKLGNNQKPGQSSTGTWLFKYQSTEVINKTTFSKLTDEWRNGQVKGGTMPLGDIKRKK